MNFSEPKARVFMVKGPQLRNSLLPMTGKSLSLATLRARWKASAEAVPLGISDYCIASTNIIARIYKRTEKS